MRSAPLNVEELSVKSAFPEYVVAPIVPFTAPFHSVVRVAEAGVAAGPVQAIGLLVNEPETVPFEMETAVTVDAQLVSLPVTVDGFVPPPVAVSGGENWIFPLNVHVTWPGAAPVNREPELAPAGVAATSAAADMTIAPSAI